MSAQSPAPKTDRQTTTPFLLKLFYRTNNWHRLDEFALNAQLPPHLQIYTWPSCTLRELTHLLTSALPSILPSPAAGTRLAYRLVYPDAKASTIDLSRPGRYLSKELGSVVVGDDSGTTNGTSDALSGLSGDADRTLQDARFIIGDYISCVVLPPLADGAIAPTPSVPVLTMRGPYGGPPSRGTYPPPSENGYSFRGRGSRAGYGQELGRGGGVPPGEWRRGERIPERGFGGNFRGRGRGW